MISASLLLPSCDASALCIGLGFSGVPSVVTFASGSGGYNVYDAGRHLLATSFQVQARAVGTTCEYFIALSTGQSGNFNQRKLSQAGNVLNYNVYTNATNTILKAPPTAAQSELISGSFSVAPSQIQTNSHSFYWTIDPQQIVPAQQAYYTDANLTLGLYQMLFNRPQLVASAAVTFRALVESSIDLSLVNAGGPFNVNGTTHLIDFGQLSSGEQRGFDLVIRTNNGYAVSMQSLNRQVMAHAQAPAIKDTVPYHVVLGGGGIDLSTGAPFQVISGAGTTPAAGVSFPIEVTVGVLSGTEAAGTYTDVITVTVTAN